MRLLPLLLLLSACGGHTRAYMDGAPLAPPEPRVTYTPAGAGLRPPEYWGTPDAPKVERSTHKRELPPTREPGLWAGDQPRAVTAPWKDREPILLGVHLPEPNTDNPLAGLMLNQRRRCAYLGDTLYDMKMRPEDLVSGSRDARACLAAYTWQICALSDLSDMQRAETEGTRFMPHMAEAIRANVAEADRFVRTTCTEDMRNDPWLARWLKVFGDEWQRFNTRGGT